MEHGTSWSLSERRNLPLLSSRPLSFSWLAMDTCFAAIHRLGTPENGLGIVYGGCSEVELRPSSDFTAVLAETTLATFQDYIRHKVVWLSPSVFLVNSEGPFDYDFHERYGSTFLLDILCGSASSRQSAAAASDLDLSVSVHSIQQTAIIITTTAAEDDSCLDALLLLLRALRVRVVCIYGDLERSLNANALAFPCSPQALSAFLQDNDTLLRLHISHFKMNKAQFDALGECLLTNLRLGFVEQVGAFPVHLNAGLLEFDVGDNFRNCLWALGEACKVRTLLIRTRHCQLVMRGNDDKSAVTYAELLARVLFAVKPLKLSLRANWFTNAKVWTVFCKSLAAHPTLQVIQLHQFVPLIPGDRLRKLCTSAVAELVKDNPHLHLVEIPIPCREERLWRKQIQPCLDLNRQLRPRLSELLANKDIDLRRKAIGVLLGRVHHHKDQIYHILRSSYDIVF